MDLGDGLIVVAEEADKIRDAMDAAVRAMPADLAAQVQAGDVGAVGARFNVATGVWSPPS